MSNLKSRLRAGPPALNQLPKVAWPRRILRIFGRAVVRQRHTEYYYEKNDISRSLVLFGGPQKASEGRHKINAFQIHLAKAFRKDTDPLVDVNGGIHNQYTLALDPAQGALGVQVRCGNGKMFVSDGKTDSLCRICKESVEVVWVHGFGAFWFGA